MADTDTGRINQEMLSMLRDCAEVLDDYSDAEGPDSEGHSHCNQAMSQWSRVVHLIDRIEAAERADRTQKAIAQWCPEGGRPVTDKNKQTIGLIIQLFLIFAILIWTQMGGGGGK